MGLRRTVAVMTHIVPQWSRRLVVFQGQKVKSDVVDGARQTYLKLRLVHLAFLMFSKQYPLDLECQQTRLKTSTFKHRVYTFFIAVMIDCVKQ